MKRSTIILLILFLTSITVIAKPPHLNVEKLFDGRYNADRSVKTSISRADGTYYRSLHVTANPNIVNTIDNALRSDSSRASKFFEQEGEGGKYTSIRIINNGETIYIGLQQYNGSAFFFIKGKEKAFK